MRLPFDLITYRDLGRMMAQLDPLPRASGGSVVYEDPSEEPARLRRALRDLVLSLLRPDGNIGLEPYRGLYHFVSLLSTAQLAHLQAEGIAWSDLDARQQAALAPMLGDTTEAKLRVEDVPKLTLRVRPAAAAAQHDERELYSRLHLQLLLAGKVVYDTPLGVDALRLRDLPAVPELPPTVTQPPAP